MTVVTSLEKKSETEGETIPYGVSLVQAFNKYYFGIYRIRIHKANSPSMVRLGYFLETGVYSNSASMNDLLKGNIPKSLEDITNGKMSRPHGNNEAIILTLHDWEQSDGALVPASLIASFPTELLLLSDEKIVEEMMMFFESERESYELVIQMTAEVYVGENALTSEEKHDAYQRKADRKNRFKGVSAQTIEKARKDAYSEYKSRSSVARYRRQEL